MKQFIPNRELDELGTGVVLTYLKKSGTAGLPRCVDIEGIANSMGLNVVYETFAEDDFDKIGFLSDGITPLKIKRGNRTVPFLFPLGTIVVEADLRKERESGKRRFTIAHEVAHHILGRHNPVSQFQRTFDAERVYSMAEMKSHFNWNETQADKLAASLLMPYFIVAAALKDFNYGNKLKIFGDEVFAPKDRMIIKKMAAQIGVSFSALLIRIKELQMVEYHPISEYVEAALMTEVIS